MAKVTVEEARQLAVGEGFSIADVDPASTPGLPGGNVDDAFGTFDDELSELQEMLYANGRAGTTTGSILLVLQGMDTSGKGGIIRHVVSETMDMQGVHLKAFGAPTEEERNHDFLWRFGPHLPEPGMISVFDRSYYEDVLVQRVKQMAPPEEIERRYGAIVDFERSLSERGVRIIKVMPHISREFQAENLKERILNPEKHWKYNPGDIEDRALWTQFMSAYEIAMKRTSTEFAPWYCVPSDDKDYCRTVVKTLLYRALSSLDLTWPPADFDPEVELERLERS
ncbi:PPK2 family polyphosphate kinase [Corynebacterium liangguodongii]|uniref:PPK2 family polyphosphate--nucleotide phosphotransferase n=1 Tax=Corynebacterium liangguodongii TaxID=2079535 RepID=A0A2S0WE92_9CORY|nr:PPK2 family polyphosphate kinase [Corynebacterium liangguodongii]AWB84093.1 PPK2 family polyphosphate--nucleotide phosphotransferase [Corynebacterium liangguodongii]PWC00104.1 PPK2 family polyphosphate--nucleotide phosphotransferase [Corynebacterium liangguodongii]